MEILRHLRNWRLRFTLNTWRRRPFLLLEVLIAFAIVTLCALPLVRAHLSLTKHERDTLRDLQLELAAHQAYVKIVERFILRDVDWNTIKKTTQTWHPLPVAIIRMPNCIESYTCTYQFDLDDEHEIKKSKRALYRFFDIQIRFSSQHALTYEPIYKYKLFIKRLEVNKEQAHVK